MLTRVSEDVMGVGRGTADASISIDVEEELLPLPLPPPLSSARGKRGTKSELVDLDRELDPATSSDIIFTCLDW